MQQLLEVFNGSRVPIAALTLGTAAGAFYLALARMQKRSIYIPCLRAGHACIIVYGKSTPYRF